MWRDNRWVAEQTLGPLLDIILEDNQVYQETMRKELEQGLLFGTIALGVILALIPEPGTTITGGTMLAKAAACIF